MRWPVLGYVPAVVALAHKRRDLHVPRPLSVAAVFGAPLAVAAGLPRGRGRAAATWAAHMWAYKTAFEVPYDRPDRLRMRLRIDEPIRADRIIGGGTPPGQRLQRRFRRPPRLHPLDYALTFFYSVWEAEPHAVLLWILLRRPERFPAAAIRLGLTFDATLVGYFAVPWAPPWWASEREGRMDRQVRRVAPEVVKALRGKPRPGLDHNSGANPWAAMPSDHFATALSTAMMLGEIDRRAGAVGGAYAALLGFALVYTGEHYVIDLLAGAALALAVQAAHASLGGPATKLAAALAAPGPRRRRLRFGW